MVGFNHCYISSPSCHSLRILRYHQRLIMENTPLPFLHEIEKLKHLPRTGWLRTIESPESVAAHSFRVAILALLAPVIVPPRLDWIIS